MVVIWMSKEEVLRSLIVRDEDVERYRLRKLLESALILLSASDNLSSAAMVSVSSEQIAPVTSLKSVADWKADIVGTVEDLYAPQIRRQEAILEASRRRTRDINERQERQRRRNQKRAERDRILLEATAVKKQESVVASRAQSTSPNRKQSPSAASLGRAATSLGGGALQKHRRDIVPQEELERRQAEERRMKMETINSQRLRNIAQQREQEKMKELEEAQFQKELEKQALKKDEMLLRKTIQEARHHYNMLQRIAVPPTGDANHQAAALEVERFSQTLNSSISSAARGAAIAVNPDQRMKDLMNLAKAKDLQRSTKAIDDRWQREAHLAAVELSNRDREIEHAKMLEHLEIVRSKQVQSLEHQRELERQKRQERGRQMEEDMKLAQRELITSLQKNQQRIQATREEERIRIARMQEAKEARQREVSERVMAAKAKEVEDMQRMMKAAGDKEAAMQAEAMEARERRILSVQQMKYAEFRQAEEERRLRLEESQRLRAAQEQREMDARERRRQVELNQLRHAGNRLRFRQAQRQALELQQAETEAFYVSVGRARGADGSDEDVLIGRKDVSSASNTELSHERAHRKMTRAAAHSRLPPHPELSGLVPFASGDVSSELLTLIESADRRLDVALKR